jgi:hypothetical protein
MIRQIRTISKLYGPILLSFLLLLLVISVKKEQNLGNVELNPTIWGISIFKFSLPITNIWITRGLLVCLSFITFSLLIIMDYSNFFPQHLEMEVFFDNDGIADSLKVFSDLELKQVRIPDNYKQFQSRYYDDVNAEISRIFQREETLFVNPKEVHSQGRTSFIVEKIFGLQSYYIKESHGELVHVVERPNKPRLQFKSFFEKLNSHYDYLKPSLGKLLIKQSIIIQPRFKQIFAENLKADGTSFHHTLIGLFKVTFFPFPKFSNTIYLMQLDDIGLIPVGYAIYRE